jgi:hypothetical protein
MSFNASPTEPAHGLDLSPSFRKALWQPLYLSLGLCVALFVVGAVTDWRGERAARAFLPWALGAGLGFFALTQVRDETFGIFVGYEAVAMFAALAIYWRQWLARRQPGAGRVTLGIALTLLAAVVQVSPMTVRVLVPLDHNGLFHIVQGIAMLVMARGLQADLAALARSDRLTTR